MLQRIALVISAITLSSCAWFMPENPSSEIIKPTPIGGYEELSTRIYYPKAIREKGVEGSITVKANISQNGEVLETRVTQALHAELDRIAENAVKRTRFNPATREGLPITVWISIPVVFALETWEEKDSPFESFEMKVFPDQAYRRFEVNLTAELQAAQKLPLRFELLLPFNAEKAWMQRGDSTFYPEQVADDNGEWLIFQIQEPVFDVNFNYEPLPGMTAKAFQYKFIMNHALPPWQLSIVYASEGVQFKLPPDSEHEEQEGLSRYTYDLKRQEAYEARFLEVALLE